MSTVQFAMKLPFPLGTLRWTNRISEIAGEGCYRFAWTLVDGDLRENEGRLTIEPTTLPSCCKVTYSVRVRAQRPIPGSAQRLATRWLLPRVIDQLRRSVETV